MAIQSTAEDRLLRRRTLLQAGAALATAGTALLRGAHAEAQPAPRGASSMTIIDSQVHAYEANTPQRPWFRVPNWPAHVTGDEMMAAMDKVGVDGAIFVSPVFDVSVRRQLRGGGAAGASRPVRARQASQPG